jgi:hypothetical protein
MISKHPQYSKEKKIILYVCDLGRGDYPQEVSNALGNTSMAPNTKIFTYSGGRTPVIADSQAKNPNAPDLRLRGKWVTFESKR